MSDSFFSFYVLLLGTQCRCRDLYVASLQIKCYLNALLHTILIIVHFSVFYQCSICILMLFSSCSVFKMTKIQLRSKF